MARKPNVSDEQAMTEMMDLLGEWNAPEPSPWFDARMMARFREEVQREPQSWLARIRDRMMFGSALSIKPMLAGAMALVLVAGGGSYLETVHLQKVSALTTSATVQDLQILDNNDQAIQQMDQLLDDPDNS